MFDTIADRLFPVRDHDVFAIRFPDPNLNIRNNIVYVFHPGVILGQDRKVGI